MTKQQWLAHIEKLAWDMAWDGDISDDEYIDVMQELATRTASDLDDFIEELGQE
jgi:hypothetical protein